MSIASSPIQTERQLQATAPSLAQLERWLTAILVIAGLVGFAAAFELSVEKFRLLENPLYVPPCSLGETVNCVSVMRSAQSEAFGFPNPFLGIAGFAGLTVSGLILATGGRLGPRYWLVLEAALVFAVAFVHWLIFQTLYRIGALCPFCMAVWTVTILAFWYVTVRNLVAYDGRPGALRKLADVAARNHGVVVTAWLLTITALVFERFWAPWDSVFA